MINRKLRRTTKKDKSRGSEDEPTLKYNSARLYSSAIISLYQAQRDAGRPGCEYPRGSALTGIFKNMKRKAHAKAHEEFEDRAAGTIIDGYTDEQFISLVKAMWRCELTRDAGVNLRTNADFLLRHCGLLRGSETRQADLADLIAFQFTNEGPTECWAMVLMLSKTKTNTENKIQYGATMRNKEILRCPVSAIAFWLMYRWHLTDEAFPDFSTHKDWYSAALFPGDMARKKKGATATEPLSNGYSKQTQNEWVNKLFEMNDIQSTKITHSGRIQGAQAMEASGVQLDEIRRGGTSISLTFGSNFCMLKSNEFVHVLFDK